MACPDSTIGNFEIPFHHESNNHEQPHQFEANLTSIQSLSSSTSSEISDTMVSADYPMGMRVTTQTSDGEERREVGTGVGPRTTKDMVCNETESRSHGKLEVEEQVVPSTKQPSLMSPPSNCTDPELEVDYMREDTLRAALEAMLFPPQETNGDDTEVALAAIEAIMFQDKNLKPGLIHKLLREIYRCMMDYKDKPEVQIQACVLMGRLAQPCSEVRKAIGETEGVQYILRALLTHKKSEVLQAKGIVTILSLTPDPGARLQLTEQKGAECVCWAMRDFPHQRNMLMNGALTLGNIAFGSQEGKKRVGKVGGVDVVVDAMYLYNEDPELLCQCCLAMRNITFGNRANQWIAGRSCAMEAIVKSMASFPDEDNIQYQGLVALENICAEEPENRDRATEMGVIDACMSILTLHKEHASLAEHGLALLRNMCIGNKENQLQIGNSGGIRLILTTMKYHRMNPRVLEAGCGAFRYMFFSKENRDCMYDTQGLEPLLAALREGSDVVSVCESALLALGNAVFDNAKSKKLVARYGGIAVMVDILSKHLDSETIQEFGCRTLRNLADSDELNTRLLGESGAIDTAIFAMMGYPENAAIQEQACAMLFNMAFSEANVRLMKKLEVARVVQHAIAFHVQNIAVESQAKALMQRIAPMVSSSSSGKGKSSGVGRHKSTAEGRGKKPSGARGRMDRKKSAFAGK